MKIIIFILLCVIGFTIGWNIAPYVFSEPKVQLSTTMNLPNGYRQIPGTHYVIDIDGDTLKQVITVTHSYNILTFRERKELYKRLKR